MKRLNLGFFASHGGSNFHAIVEAIKQLKLNARACCVISNNSESQALARARNLGIPAYHISSKVFPDRGLFVNEIISTLERHGVDTIVLAGYMKLLPPEVVKHFKGRAVNIHPALLPEFGGKGMYGINVHKAVIEASKKESGPTVHVISSEYDEGRILAQRKVPVLPDDNPESLAARVLEEEHKIYAETLQKIATGELVL